METAAQTGLRHALAILRVLEGQGAIVPIRCPSSPDLARHTGIKTFKVARAALRRCARKGWVRLCQGQDGETVQVLVTASAVEALERQPPRAAKPMTPRTTGLVNRLMAWLEHDLGREEGDCPSNAAIGARLGIRGAPAVTRVLNAAQDGGYLAFSARTGGNAIRRVRVLRDPPCVPKVKLAKSGPVGPVPAARAAQVGFASWLRQAAPGERHVYFSGHLASARGLSAKRPDAAERRRVFALAEDARAAQDTGQVLLTARRRDDGAGCDYIAIRCRP